MCLGGGVERRRAPLDAVEDDQVGDVVEALGGAGEHADVEGERERVEFPGRAGPGQWRVRAQGRDVGQGEQAEDVGFDDLFDLSSPCAA